MYGNEGVKKLISVMDPCDKLAAALKGCRVIMTANETYYDGFEKKSYAAAAEKPCFENGELYVPREIMKRLFKTYQSAERFTEGEKNKNCGMYMVYDRRGFFVLSQTRMEKTPEDHYTDRFIKWHPIDLIYRFMQFDNPDGEEMIRAVKKRYPGKKHPRVIYDDKDIARIREKTLSGEWKKALDTLCENADTACRRRVCREEPPDEKKQRAAGDALDDMRNLAEAYMITGERRYMLCGVELMKIFAAWSTLAPRTSNLITGYWCGIMGIGLDAFYKDIKKANLLEYFKERVKCLTYKDHIDSYSGRENLLHYIKMQDNFIGVISGNLALLCLALADEEDMEEETAYILENMIKTMEIETGLFFPDGGYYEGVAYSSYLFDYFTYGLNALFKCCGTDYSVGAAKGFAKAGDIFTSLQTNKYCAGYHDGSELVCVNDVREFMAYRYGNTGGAEASRIMKENIGAGRSVDALLWYEYALQTKTDIAKAVPLDRYFAAAYTGAFKNSNTAKNPTFASFHGGRNGLPHSMPDLGEFQFEKDGVMWAYSLGGDSYSLPGYFDKAGYNLYRKRTEGKNCVVINPSGSEYSGQKESALAPLIKYVGNEKDGGFAEFDLSDAYERDVSSYKRSFDFCGGRSTYVITDEIELLRESEVYWFMHTPAKIEISGDTAFLEAEGKRLCVRMECSIKNHSFYAMDAVPLPCSPHVEGQNPNKGIRKLVLYAKAPKGTLKISARLA